MHAVHTRFLRHAKEGLALTRQMAEQFRATQLLLEVGPDLFMPQSLALFDRCFE